MATRQPRLGDVPRTLSSARWPGRPIRCRCGESHLSGPRIRWPGGRWGWHQSAGQPRSI